MPTSQNRYSVASAERQELPPVVGGPGRPPVGRRWRPSPPAHAVAAGAAVTACGEPLVGMFRFAMAWRAVAETGCARCRAIVVDDDDANAATQQRRGPRVEGPEAVDGTAD